MLPTDAAPQFLQKLPLYAMFDCLFSLLLIRISDGHCCIRGVQSRPTSVTLPCAVYASSHPSHGLFKGMLLACVGTYVLPFTVLRHALLKSHNVTRLREIQAPGTNFRIFLNAPNFFFLDTASVHTHPANSAANPDSFTTCGRGNQNPVNKLTSVFYASVLLLLIMNFVITLSKQLWIHEAIAEWIRRLL